MRRILGSEHERLLIKTLDVTIFARVEACLILHSASSGPGCRASHQSAGSADIQAWRRALVAPSWRAR